MEGSTKAGNVSDVDNNRHRRGYYSWFYWARTTQNKSGLLKNFVILC